MSDQVTQPTTEATAQPTTAATTTTETTTPTTTTATTTETTTATTTETTTTPTTTAVTTTQPQSKPQSKPQPQPKNATPKNPSAKKSNDSKPKKDKNAWKNLKTAKGTRDSSPEQMAVREKVFKIITDCFKRHGAVTIDTPAFELKETLTGKYGEDSKLIYDLDDQGGEICSLRYDLTVPLARFIAMNRIKQIKRYHIARVYRRDNPVMTKGRFREFYQCDFDIAGIYDSMIPDSECLALMVEILTRLQMGAFEVKLNHRFLLDGIFEICGVPEDKFRTICSAVDKLDKLPWAEVRKEMVEQKGLAPESADKIEKFVCLKGRPIELREQILSSGMCAGSKKAQTALEELGLLFEYLSAYQVLDQIVLDLSLARGLDYYTGLIYEAVMTEGSEVGSIAAGGRYDGLVGIFGGEDIPAVGFSIGIERILTIMEQRSREQVRACETEVFVVSIDKGLVRQRMEICRDLWANDIKAEMLAKKDPKIQAQLNYANTIKTPWVIVFGATEIEQGTVQLKNMILSQQETINRVDLVGILKQRLQK
eukprot:TRINITY_DN412_c0_g1_i1.p1 TRINITY_DN412_c0_g1~~TRINITY_DN412_c0_g1_i1.p1  ORF type:complete len:538 (+),score=279.13 TRINITY_DN412_c0_g1_i1:96-1709(+)